MIKSTLTLHKTSATDAHAHLEIHNGYSIKDDLKADGFKFIAPSKSWTLELRGSSSDLANRVSGLSNKYALKNMEVIR